MKKKFPTARWKIDVQYTDEQTEEDRQMNRKADKQIDGQAS